MTIEQLGKKLKQTYPEYRNLSDEEAGRRILDTHPGYRNLCPDYIPPQPENPLQTNQLPQGAYISSTGFTVIPPQQRAPLQQPPPQPAIFGNRPGDPFDQVTLPPRPDLPVPSKSIPDHLQDAISGYEVNQGWWRSLFAERRAKVVSLLADQAEALKRIQLAQSAAQAEEMLRGINLWNSEIAAALKGEQATTDVYKARHERAKVVRQEQWEQQAAANNLTPEIYTTKVSNDETLRVKREEKTIEFEDHERRETLKTNLAVREYTEKSKAALETAMVSDRLARERMKELDSLIVQWWQLKTDLTVDPTLKALRIRPMEARMKQLEAQLGLERVAQAPGETPDGENNGGSGQGTEPGGQPQEPMGNPNQSNSAKGNRILQ